MVDPLIPGILIRRPLREWFPDEATAETCLGLLADLIVDAHESGSARWVLSLREARTLTLSVGALLVLRFSDDGSADVAVDTETLERLRPTSHAPIPVSRDDVFVKAPGVALLRLSATVLAAYLPWMRPAIDVALPQAAATVRVRTSYYLAHSADAVRLVGDFFGEDLPQPDYRVVANDDEIVTTWSAEAIREAWRSYGDTNDEWRQRAEAIVRKVRSADAVAFRSEEVQRTLWEALSFSSLGSSGCVDASSAYTDDKVLDLLDALRSTLWPTELDARASAIGAAYQAVLECLSTLGIPAVALNLERTFAILIPEQFTAELEGLRLTRLNECLFGKTPVGDFVEIHLKIRERLRELLGPEADLSEHVARISFCRWLHGAQSPLEGELPRGAVDGRPASFDDSRLFASASTERLILWSFGRQHRGIAAISGYSATWRDLLRAAQAGQTVAALIDEVRQTDSAGAESVKALQYGLSRMLALDLVQREDGVYLPTEAGLRVLEGDNDPLIEALLVRNYGFAQVLRHVARARTLARSALYRALRDEYPQWTSDFSTSSLLAWTFDLGLTEVAPDRSVQLTDYGLAWHARLPDLLPTPPVAPTERDDEGVSEIVSGPPVAFPSLDAILGSMEASEEARGFVIDRSSLAALHAGWTANPTKHFVILSGLSGTGKTAVLRHYARAVCSVLGLASVDHVRLVTVSPDWHDPTGLLGYFNALGSDPGFQPEPAVLLLDAARRDPERPYFLILDEMNLARVERYLAPLLSAMESGEPIAVHSSPAEKHIPQQIAWPRNLYLAGTVNMDESTYPFSDKVLDRAFTLEFWEVDLGRFFARRERRHPDAEALLLALHGAFAPARRHFGYRTAGEVIDFVLAMEAAGESTVAALDHAVFSKVLPKLRGDDDPVLRTALQTALRISTEGSLTRSRERLALMLRRLESSGVTRFWS